MKNLKNVICSVMLVAVTTFTFAFAPITVNEAKVTTADKEGLRCTVETNGVKVSCWLCNCADLAAQAMK